MKKLSDTEFEIMKVLWESNQSLTSNEILEKVKDKHQWNLASIMTVLARMVEKGYVYCDRSTRTNYYSAVISKEQYRIEESETFLEKLYDKSAVNLIASLYHGRKISQKEIEELRNYLDLLGEK